MNTLEFPSSFSVTLTVILVILMQLAWVFELACLKEKTIPDNTLSVASRRLAIAGWIIYSVRLLYLLWEGNAGHIHPAALIAFILVALSCVLRTGNRLHLIGHIHEQAEANKEVSHNGT